MAAIFTQLQPRFVDNDMDQPSAELALPPKTGKTAARLEHCFLYYFFGVRLIAHDTERNAVDHPFALMDQLPERFRVFCGSAIKELGFQ